MNYIHLINDFWARNETAGFTSTEIALYFYLLKINSSCFWKSSFSHNNYKIMATVCISFNTLKKSLKSLNEAGLIEFKTKNGSPNVTYQILTSSNFHKVTDEVPQEDIHKVTDEINKTKSNQTKPSFKKEAKEKKFDFKKSLIEYGFKENLIEDWLKVRKTKKATNTKTGFDLFIKQVEKSEMGLDSILETCIERSWSTFKTEWINNVNNHKNNSNGNEQEFRVNGQTYASATKTAKWAAK